MPTQTINYSSVTDTVDIPITLASLASSTTLIAGRTSAIVDNRTNKFVDAILRGQITTGTGVTADRIIQVWTYAPIRIAASAFTYPTAGTTELTESDAAQTFVLQQKFNLLLAWASTTSANTSEKYSFGPLSIAAVYGGIMPIKWGIFVTQNTGANLNATASNHWFNYTGVKYDSN